MDVSSVAISKLVFDEGNAKEESQKYHMPGLLLLTAPFVVWIFPGPMESD